jgi:hypothetical protein
MLTSLTFHGLAAEWIITFFHHMVRSSSIVLFSLSAELQCKFQRIPLVLLAQLLGPLVLIKRKEEL